MPEVSLESEEWYVLCNWLRERENRLQYSLRPQSREWKFVHDLRREIEHDRQREIEHDPQQEAEAQNRRIETSTDSEPVETSTDSETVETVTDRETAETGTDRELVDTSGRTRTVALSERQVAYLDSYLRRRARKLLLFPWRDRERRDVRHLRDHLLAEVGRVEFD